MDKDIALLHQKIDFLTEQILVSQRRQKEMEELKQDLTPIMGDLFKTAVEELEQVATHFTYEDLIFLIKKLLRNTRNLIVLFEQMESARDFLQDAVPLGKDIFNTLLDNMEELNKKGYFELLNTLLNTLDHIMSSMTPDDFKKVAQFTEKFVTAAKRIVNEPQEKVSTFKLLREANSPQVKQSMAIGLKLLKAIS
ncbi:DUF1641 domain-containing protein [candidate division KSB1 bacterium]|nr:DUF1641 domain-containing protein [candidate division KSB1 bacterium]